MHHLEGSLSDNLLQSLTADPVFADIDKDKIIGSFLLLPENVQPVFPENMQQQGSETN